jgi:hypothetical protein
MFPPYPTTNYSIHFLSTTFIHLKNNICTQHAWNLHAVRPWVRKGCCMASSFGCLVLQHFARAQRPAYRLAYPVTFGTSAGIYSLRAARAIVLQYEANIFSVGYSRSIYCAPTSLACMLVHNHNISNGCVPWLKLVGKVLEDGGGRGGRLHRHG